ncbi:hypothetical protein [Legionella jordanis]|uniref:1,4-alpha-glucan branching enzyme n=1 Tax=Legionella jordanis TaxID=456 RepID=A0A0W0VFW8_9GAMM|nr:hypothetical protein [Legionella jordanis]KTD19059.1 hypothetical protein Ljor_0282 [Legionella jordanis]RMX05388.1 hypothetical protein EAW55_01660 [Legionella jordanis]VEH13162.1 Uncharacterised protein [Legionella jordanis]HAT8714819.1 hypothetical protein [Legionella jordanis]
MTAQTHATSDHGTIKKWAEVRNAKPAKVKGAGHNGSELLRFDFPGYTGKDLEEISWSKWFDIFDENDLALIYQEETADGKKSNFNKIVSKETAKNIKG